MKSSPASKSLCFGVLSGVLLFSVSFILSVTPAAAQGRRVLKTHFAPPPQAHAIGRMPGTQQLSLALTLSLRNQAQLNALLQQLYDPKSANYRHFLTVQQFTSQFGPSVAEYQKVVNFARSYGLTVTNTTPNRLVLDVRGTVAQIDGHIDAEAEAFRKRLASPEARAAFAAFLGKKK